MNKEEKKLYEKFFKKIVIEHLRETRLEKGWTQAQVAEAACVSHEFIRDLESEKGTYYISTFSIWLIAKALDADLNGIFDFDMEAFKHVIEKAMQEKSS